MNRRHCNKPSAQERHGAWKENFRQHCFHNGKIARQDLVHRHREDQWLQWIAAQEWEEFKKSHQDALQKVGLRDYIDMEERVETPISKHQDRPWKKLSSQDTVACMHCHCSALYPLDSSSVATLECPSCGFRATLRMIQTIQDHTILCDGSIVYTYQSDSSSVLGSCSLCGSCVVF
ncbi:hypothetical protein BDF14DRAFT_1821771 [Spinellus fusiger]|nr:hypothetical protein BDF14DRAFT_1821771 [Spinellus fusiger]